jgi:flagellar protein FliO/FliZ
MTGMSQPASPLSVGSLTQLTLSLIAIVALILVISWALKRLKLAGPRGSGAMTVLDEISVGPRERIVLIRVGESQVLIGIGASGLVPLTPLAVPIALKEGGRPPAPAFAERLRDLMKRPGGSA